MFWFFWLRGMWDLTSPTRDRTHTHFIGRQSLNYWTTREVPLHSQSHFMAQNGCCCIIHHIYILGGSKKGEEGKKMSCPLKSALFEELFYKFPQWFLLYLFVRTLSGGWLYLKLQGSCVWCMSESPILGTSCTLSLPIWSLLHVWTSALVLSLTFSYLHQS